MTREKCIQREDLGWLPVLRGCVVSILRDAQITAGHSPGPQKVSILRDVQNTAGHSPGPPKAELVADDKVPSGAFSREGCCLPQQRAAACTCQAGTSGNARRWFILRSSPASDIGAAFSGCSIHFPSFTGNFLSAISYKCPQTRLSAAKGGSANSAGAVWFIITLLLGGQPS